LNEAVPAPRPSLLLGCGVGLAILVMVVIVGGACIVFAESGSDAGSVTMENIAVYPPGSISRRADRGFYVVGLPGGGVVAFSDLDAANRTAEGRRCRVSLMEGDDPAHALAIEEFGERLSPESGGTPLLLREECNGALYDVAGIRIDADGRNLDRYRVDLDDAERLVVFTASRTCSERKGREFALDVDC